MPRPSTPLSDDERARFKAFCDARTERRVQADFRLNTKTIWRAKNGLPVTEPIRARILAAMEAADFDGDAADMARQTARIAAERAARVMLTTKGLNPDRAAAIARFVVPDDPKFALAR